MDFGQTIKYWFETTCFEQTIPLTVRYFTFIPFTNVAENQQNLKAIQNKKCEDVI